MQTQRLIAWCQIGGFHLSFTSGLWMIRILYLVPPAPHFAGMERVVHGVASGLATQFADRFEVTVLYSQRYAEVSGSLPYKVIFENTQQLRTFPRRVVPWLHRGRYDIVIGAQFEATALVWLPYRLRGGKARFIMHLHGNPKVEESGSTRARVAFRFFGFVSRRMRFVLTVSPSLKDYVCKRLGPFERVRYIPNPVRQFAEVVPRDLGEGPVSFVSVGRLERQKGHDILVSAIAKLVERGVDARLTLVGEGQERESLVRQIDQLGLGGRVRLTGSVSDPAAELADAHCFVSASRWEGFGLAIVEAQSAGLYVIATDCEFGPSDIIDNGTKGRIVPVEDPEAFAGAMYEFAQSKAPDLHRQLRRDAAARYSISNVVAEHAAMLSTAITNA